MRVQHFDKHLLFFKKCFINTLWLDLTWLKFKIFLSKVKLSKLHLPWQILSTLLPIMYFWKPTFIAGISKPATGELPSCRLQLNPAPSHLPVIIKLPFYPGVFDWGWNWNLQDGSSPGAGLVTLALQNLVHYGVKGLKRFVGIGLATFFLLNLPFRMLINSRPS